MSWPDSPEIPSDWTWTPFDAFAEVAVSTVDKKSYPGEIPVRLCNYTDVYYNDVITGDSDFMAATATADQVRRFAVREGDVAITKDSESSDDIGRPAFVPKDLPGVVYGYHLAVYRPFDQRHGRFLRYVFDSSWVRLQLQLRTPGVTRVGLNQDTLRNLKVPVPSPDTAGQIADYLDRETAEIDAFVADLSEFKRLVRARWRVERDQMLFGAADGNCDSARELTYTWFPELDRRHKEVAFKHLFMVTLGKMLDEKKHDALTPEWPYVRAGNITEDGLDLTDTRSMPFSDSEQVKYSLVKNDLLVVEGGSIGTNAVLGRDIPDLYFQKTVNRARPRSGVDSHYYSEVLNAYNDRGVFDVIANKSTIRHLTAEKLNALQVPAPPTETQKQVALQLRLERERIGVVLAEADEAIALAKERRAALISAAVTGKIDVTEKHKSAAEQLEDDLAEAR